ncbi:MAG: hypothetical protein Q9198_001755 [Flavoplaca austrocitrina]
MPRDPRDYRNYRDYRDYRDYRGYRDHYDDSDDYDLFGDYDDDDDYRYEDESADFARDPRNRMVLKGNAVKQGAFLGPEDRETRPKDKGMQKDRWVRESDGDEYLYRYVKNIGVGGQGQCDLYQRSGSSGKLVVCKVMKRGFDMALDRKGREMPAEAIILKQILGSHPLICKLQSFTSHTFWFEYCGLGDLHDLSAGYIKNRTSVPEAFIWHAYRQLAEAFAYIHTGYCSNPNIHPPDHFETIIHRDVKPSNIFLRPNPNSTYPDLVLADFGIAATAGVVRKQNGHLQGTPIFQPPEIPCHSIEGDIWSAGACLHVLATGTPPIRTKPRGRDPKEWAKTPDARAVADLRSLGYSHNLHAAMMWTLRRRREDRLVGKQLVGYVTRGQRDFHARGGKTIELAKWVGKKM